MSFLARIFRMLSAEPSRSFDHSQLMVPDTRPGGQGGPAARHNTRRELLQVVLRETLNRQGIPASWLGADALVSTSRTGMQGVHWRLLVRHWDPRLVTHAVALQRKLFNRVMMMDPLAANWLTGISWQFAIADESVCPAMPHPGTWTAPTPQAAPMEKAKPAQPQPTVEVIAGPVRISDPGRSKQQADAEVRADLERLLSARQADYQRHSTGDGPAPQGQFMRTQPMSLPA